MNRIQSIRGAMVLSLPVLLAACGGGGSSDEDTTSVVVAEGVFLDAPVEGLSYRSGQQSGQTGPGGTFSYEVGQEIAFSVAGVDIGRGPAGPIVTPVTLAGSGADETHPMVGNIVRFLMTLDSDGDVSNGIQITVGQSLPDGLSLDFSIADPAAFADAAGPLIAELAPGRTLVGLSEAQQHFDQTLSDMIGGLVGSYSGSFSGGNQGSWTITVDGGGAISGTANSTVTGLSFPVDGKVTASGRGAFGYAGTASFSGVFSLDGCFAGKWKDLQSGDTGVFSGSREGSAASACDRLADAADSPAPGDGNPGGGTTVGGEVGGQLNLIGQSSELGSLFVPVDQMLIDMGIGDWWSVVLTDQSLSEPPGSEQPLVAGFTINRISNAVSAISFSKGSQLDPSYYEYTLECYNNLFGCPGAYFDPDANTVSLTNIVLTPTDGHENNLASGTLTLTGTVSFTRN